MDFSSPNPKTSTTLNLAARNNDLPTVRRLLIKMNPNCMDNRGWTCLHEAAFNDSYESLMVILNHPDCRPLDQTPEGHTALHLACRNRKSIKIIKALLGAVKDIVNYRSTQGVSPLHIVSGQGRVQLIDLFIEYGAKIDVQDRDGYTPLHYAAIKKQHEAVASLLHAGADPEIENEDNDFTAFHLACSKGCLVTVKNMYPFISDINHQSYLKETPLMLALLSFNEEIVYFLLKNGADTGIKNSSGEIALDVALSIGFNSVLDDLLAATSWEKINPNIIYNACKPRNFRFEILEKLLISNLGPEFYDFIEPFDGVIEEIGNCKPCYYTNAPLNSFLNISEYIYIKSQEKLREFLYLFLIRGVGVDAAEINECPPLVYIHYCLHRSCFKEVFGIFIDIGCNVDYCSSLLCLNKDQCIPDAFHASLASDPSTILNMLVYSLNCEPDLLLRFANDNGILGRIPNQVQKELLTLIFNNCDNLKAESLQYYVKPLKHFCRLRIRSVLKNKKGGIKSTTEYLNQLNKLPVPAVIRNYLRYL